LPKLSSDEQTLAYRFAHVALPDDAVQCGPWQWHGGDDWRRYFLTREWNVAGIWVSVEGEQGHHGDVRRWMHVGGEDGFSTADRHDLMTALQEAGRLFDSLGPDEPRD
jgi:hypothetical protein